ncbi:hypothetical protein SK128_009831 [Halocaridina rubra]|uniref:Palmitoyltransferase n=1 Tax=Halocaridina rubra TaxID=373956 RepID=A0AAN9AH53_HALRR
MRLPLCICHRAWSALVNTDKIIVVKRVIEFLTSLAPLTTFIIIFLLTYFSYQLLETSGVNTLVVYFFSIELYGNWLLFFFTTNYIDKSSGNSELAPGLSHEDCKQLRYCPTCKIFKPERSHHCSLCDRCIHQRDHHCFFLGTCVGGYNLCYFIIFCFYACIGGQTAYEYNKVSLHLRKSGVAKNFIISIFPPNMPLISPEDMPKISQSCLSISAYPLRPPLS